MTGPKQTFFFLTFCTTTTITGFSQPATLSVSWPFLTNHFFFRYFSSLHRPSLTQIEEHIFLTRDSAPAFAVIFAGEAKVHKWLRTRALRRLRKAWSDTRLAPRFARVAKRSMW